MEQEGKTDNTYVMNDNTYVMTDEERAKLMRKRTLPPIKEVTEEEEPDFENMFSQLCCVLNRKKTCK